MHQMPRSRLSEMPEKQSTRVPIQVRTSSSSSISDPLHHRATTERSPRLALGRRSPRGGSQSDPPANQKKLGIRIADLESQLGQAQNELKSLKNQLASAEAAKKAAQEQLDDKKPKRKSKATTKRSPPSEDHESNGRDSNLSIACEVSNEDQQETDVFEVPVEKPEVKAVELSLESSVATDETLEKPLFSNGELALKNEDINLVKATLEARERELEMLCKENESLKIQINEKFVELSSTKVKNEEISTRLSQVLSELETSKSNASHIQKKLEDTEKVKEELENEMNKLRVQTEQWRKAADAAAAILAGEGAEMNKGGRRLSERCGSMDKQLYGGGGGAFEQPPPVSGFEGGFIGSPGLHDDSDDVYGNGKRRSSGIRMFGDLWKKKGQK